MLKHLGQLFFIGISGKALTEDEKKFIVENDIGGICLFSRNLEDPKQIFDLCQEIQSLKSRQASRMPLFIGIDMEGGRVHRLQPPFTRWPAIKILGDLDSSSAAFKFGLFMGDELRSVGINLNFAPCVDVLTNPKNEIIGDRSVSTDPEMVGKIASGLARGYIKSGILCCAKHYPGHGNTLLDSHLDLPVEDVARDRMEEVELPPFKKAIRSRLDFMMTAHIKYSNVDPDWPATLSKIWLKDILRDELRYRGLIISDDLDMKALADNYDKADIPVRALQAGCDVLLYCNEPDSPPVAIEAVTRAIDSKELDSAEIQASIDRVLAVKKKKLMNQEPVSLKEATTIIGHPDHMRLASSLRDGELPEDILAK